MTATEARFQIDMKPGEQDQYGTLLTTGFAALSTRRGLGGAGTTSASGSLNLSFFRAPRTMSVSTLATVTGSQIAVGATLIRFGLYSVVLDGPLNLIASTPNDSTLLGTASVRSSKALSAPVFVTRGAWYAVGLLAVVATTSPSIASLPANALTNVPLLSSPRLNGTVSGQADLPASIANASIAASNINLYFELT